MKDYKTRLKRRLIKLGTYRPEYDMSIEILAQLMGQYDMLTGKFEASGYAIAETTANGSKKAPIVTTLESLRKDILAYMTALGLTPAGAKKLDAGQKGDTQSALVKALMDMRDDTG